MSQGKTENFSQVERIKSGEIYTTSDIISLLRVDKSTVTFWYALGLEYTPVSPHPKSKRFVLGDSLIAFLKIYGMAMKMVALMGQSDGEEEIDEET